MFCAANCLFYRGVMFQSVFISLNSKTNGISRLKAGNLILFYGVSNTNGSQLAGILTRYTVKSKLLPIAVCMLLLGGSCLEQHCQTTTRVCYFCFHISLGLFLVLRTISFEDMFGVDSRKDNYGIMMLGIGVSTLLGRLWGGRLEVYWGMYFYGFFVTTVIFILKGNLSISISILK